MRKTNYSRVAPNIYRDGASFRVRVSVNGVPRSRNCRTKTEAMRVRKQLLQEQL